jgi:hypothetical protein
MEAFLIPSVTYSVLGVLCTFGATMAFSSKSISAMVATQWHEDGEPTLLNRIIGYFFNIRNRTHVSNLFLGGTFEEMRRRTDSNSPARGIGWTAFATFFIVLSLIYTSQIDTSIFNFTSYSEIVLFPNLLVKVGIVASFLYGLCAERIFKDKEQQELAHKKFGFYGHVHQFWLNFVGAATGWFTFYLFILSLQKVGIENLSFLHLTFLLTAVLGITGWLPMTLSGVLKALSDVVARLISKI